MPTCNLEGGAVRPDPQNSPEETFEKHTPHVIPALHLCHAGAPIVIPAPLLRGLHNGIF